MNEAQFDWLRERMVREQLQDRGISDARVLDAMRRVPRHRFVPQNEAAHAYEDRPLHIGFGQTISQPLMVAVMLQAAKLTGEERVLEVGAGSGYQAALLAGLAKEVTTIERLPDLARQAEQTLKELKYANVEILVGDGSEGVAPPRLFDRILVAAGAPGVPESLLAQLVPGGRLIIPVGPADEQTLTIVSKDAEGHVFTHDHGPCAFVPLIGEQGWPDHSRPG